MPVSKAQQTATAKYKSKTYDRLAVEVPKGRKAELQAHAAVHDGSLNKFVNRAIDETVERDSAKGGG